MPLDDRAVPGTAERSAGEPPLRQFAVPSAPGLYYWPHFISPLEERQLLENVSCNKGAWRVVSGRRLQNVGGLVTAKGLVATSLPAWADRLARHIHYSCRHVFGSKIPNHVLVNAYAPGDGIFPHTDGPLYEPVVAILSLGAPAVMRFTPRRNESGDEATRVPDSAQDPARRLSVILRPCSLLVFSDELYSNWLHGIDFVKEDVLDDSVVNSWEAFEHGPAGCGEPNEAPCSNEDSRGASESSASDLMPNSLPRKGERVSLTVRHVPKTMRSLVVKLGAK